MLADDLAQETFIKAFYAWDSFAALSSPRTWLMRIAYTTFVNYTRTHHATEDMKEESTDTEHVPTLQSDLSAHQDIRLDVQSALRLLSPPERLCVQLVLVEDRSIRQTATITGMNENTVKSHLRRGKDKLKTYLQSNGYQ